MSTRIFFGDCETLGILPDFRDLKDGLTVITAVGDNDNPMIISLFKDRGKYCAIVFDEDTEGIDWLIQNLVGNRDEFKKLLATKANRRICAALHV